MAYMVMLGALRPIKHTGAAILWFVATRMVPTKNNVKKYKMQSWLLLVLVVDAVLVSI